VLGLDQALIRVLLQEELELGLFLDKLLGKEIGESLKVCIGEALVEELGLLLLDLLFLESLAIPFGRLGLLIRLIAALEEGSDVLLAGLSLSLVLLFHLTSPLCCTFCLQLLVLLIPFSLLQELSSSC
jgi:hypothetical protein